MAQASINPTSQQSLNDIGHHWMRLAAELETVLPLIAVLEDIAPDQTRRVVPYRKAG
jgi:hypothetical protein